MIRRWRASLRTAFRIWFRASGGLPRASCKQLIAYVQSVGKLPRERIPGDAKRGAPLQESRVLVVPHRRRRGRHPRPGSHRHGLMRGAAYCAKLSLRLGSRCQRARCRCSLRLRRVPARTHRDPDRAANPRDPGQRRCVHDSGARRGRQVLLAAKERSRAAGQADGEDLMPSFYLRLTAPELTDLVAYLASLRGTEQ